MALSEEDKTEFQTLFADSMKAYEAAKEEEAAKNPPGDIEPPPSPAPLTFAERILGVKR